MTIKYAMIYCTVRLLIGAKCQADLFLPYWDLVWNKTEQISNGSGSCSTDQHPIVNIERVTLDSSSCFGNVSVFLGALTTALCSTRALTCSTLPDITRGKMEESAPLQKR